LNPDTPRRLVKTPSPAPRENHLLTALPDAEWQRWLPHLERVAMPLGQVLYESGDTLSHVYFPTTAIVSLLYVMENGASSAFRCSWAAIPRPAVRSFKAPDGVFG
jgi:hypothetical protein